MTLTYTTRTAIANLLPGRLTIGGIGAPFGPGVVDGNVIEQVGQQVEARVNAQLSKLYALPLINPQPVISSIVEKLILCELLSIHSLGEEQAIAGSQGVDRSYTGSVCKRGNQELLDVLNGVTPLAGEQLAVEETPSTTNLTFVGLRRSLLPPDRDVGLIDF